MGQFCNTPQLNMQCLGCIVKTCFAWVGHSKVSRDILIFSPSNMKHWKLFTAHFFLWDKQNLQMCLFSPTNVINHVFFHFSCQASRGVSWTPHGSTNIHFKTSVITIFNSFWKLTGRYWILERPWTVKVICKIILFIFFPHCLQETLIWF